MEFWGREQRPPRSPQLTCCGQPQRGVIPNLTQGFPRVLGFGVLFKLSNFSSFPRNVNTLKGCCSMDVLAPKLPWPSCCIWDTLARCILRKGVHGTAQASWQGGEFEATAFCFPSAPRSAKPRPPTHPTPPLYQSQNLFLGVRNPTSQHFL